MSTPNLPLILCGPLLRRVSQRSVYVWILLSKPLNLRLKIFFKSDETDAETLISESGKFQPVKISDRCFVYLLSALAGKDAFPDTGTLQYDVFQVSDAGEIPLFDNSVLSQILMPGMSRPSFKLPALIEKTTRPIYFGSCRNQNGKGADAGTGLLNMISDSYLRKSWDEVPQALFLTGDQVYSDDLGSDFRPVITYCRNWIGPADKLEETYEALTDRNRFISDFFTSEADWHLLSFREFAAQYLLAWNPDVWDSTNKSFDAPRLAAASWRRIFANVSTYMILDDHEITDDWNLNKKWIKKSQENRDGRRVLANGLAAYWLFQGWGNTPAEFGLQSLPDSLVSKYVSELPTNTSNKDKSKETYEKLFSQKGSWTFVSATIPSCIFLDTRSQRIADDHYGKVDDYFDSNDFEDPPKKRQRLSDVLLLPKRKVSELRDLVDSSARTLALVVISTTPVFGAAEIEQSIQQARLDGILGLFNVSPEALDLEGWFTNPRNMESFLEDFIDRIRPPRIVFLSGDVHYSFGTYGLVKTPSARPVPFLQITSSAIKNEPSGTARLAERFVSYENLKKTRRSMYWRIGQGRFRVADFQENAPASSDTARRKFGTPFLDVARKYWQMGTRSQTRFLKSNFGKISFTVGGKVTSELYSVDDSVKPKLLVKKTWDGNLASLDYPRSTWAKFVE